MIIDRLSKKEVYPMHFDVPRVPNPNVQKYEDKDLEIAYDFSKKAYKEFGSFLKCIVLFGATARHETRRNDIDILLVVDDLKIQLNDEMVTAYRVIVEKMVLETSPRLHITTLKFTNFWEYARAGDPIAINIMRDGIALIDVGFFEPMQALLRRGRIRPTYESVFAYYNRAPMTISSCKGLVLQATLDLYWAVIDAAHAALMSIGEIPPSPEHVADLLEKRFCENGKLDKKYAKTVRKFYILAKSIMHRHVPVVKGSEFDKYLVEAEEFVARMHDIVYDKNNIK